MDQDLALQTLNDAELIMHISRPDQIVKIYSAFGEIIKTQPELKGRAVDLFYTVLDLPQNTPETLKSAYKVLTDLISDNQEDNIKLSSMFWHALRSDKNNRESLEFANALLGDFIINNPQSDFVPTAFTCLETSICSEKNERPQKHDPRIGPRLPDNTPSVSNIYDILASIVKVHPQFASYVFDNYKIALQLDKNVQEWVEHACIKINRVVQKQPQFAHKIIEIIERTRRSDVVNSNLLKVSYMMLNNILNVPNEAEFESNALQLFHEGLNSDLNNASSLAEANIGLGNIIVERPELADEVFASLKISLKSNKNEGSSLSTFYDTLHYIISNIPEARPRAVELFTQALGSHRNNKNSLLTAYVSIGSFAYGKPELAVEAFDLWNLCLKSEHNNSESMDIACQVLDVILKANPDLVHKVFETEKSDEDKLFLFRTCLKHCSLNEAIAAHPEIENDLRLVNKGRFSNNAEFLYALRHFGKDKLKDSNIFSAQHRVMNVLVSTLAQQEGISKEDAVNFRKPDISSAVQNCVEDNESWLIPASFKAAAIFKEYFPSYMKTIINYNRKNPIAVLPVHDAVYWLPEPMSDESNARFANFIQRNIIYQNANHQDVHRPLEELNIIAQNWKTLEKELQKQNGTPEIGKLIYADVLSICKSVKYDDQRHSGFAAEAAKHGVSEAKYHEYEDIYLAGISVPEPFDSKKEFKEGKYKGRFLPRDDVRVGFFGNYTDCCQHFNGVGHSCAVSTVKEPFSQLFVIEDEKGQIIAGSWVWENTEGNYRDVCFDNIESLGDLKKRPELNKIYEQVGDYLTKEQNCRKVTIGLGYQDADVSKYEETQAIQLPFLYRTNCRGGYSDAYSQVLLAENPNAKLLDKTKESKRYIRDVCFLDVEAMDRISDEVFPEGDQALQLPENMSGFVIEDYQKGVVGYVLFDKEKKDIYDMAVLPEYRTDKNASSGKLMLEMLKVVKQVGGQWHAELRDKTTLRYMEIMEKRGVVKLTKHGVDHEMSDGSKVVSVTFEPVKDELRLADERTRLLLNQKEDNVQITQKAANASRFDSSNMMNKKDNGSR